MTDVRFFRPENRLAKLLARPGGMTVATVLERAIEGIETLRAGTMTAIDLKIEEMVRECASSQPNRFDVIRQLAAELFGDAGAFGLGELSLAAKSLHDLVDTPGAKPSARVIMVHLDAMRALRRPAVSGTPASRQAVLKALTQLSRQIAAQAATATEHSDALQALDQGITDLRAIADKARGATAGDDENEYPLPSASGSGA